MIWNYLLFKPCLGVVLQTGSERRGLECKTSVRLRLNPFILSASFPTSRSSAKCIEVMNVYASVDT